MYRVVYYMQHTLVFINVLTYVSYAVFIVHTHTKTVVWEMVVHACSVFVHVSYVAHTWTGSTVARCGVSQCFSL